MTWRIICRSSDYVFKSAKNMALVESRQMCIYSIFRDDIGFYYFRRMETTISKEIQVIVNMPQPKNPQ